jgi:endoribonuclease LACTB2
MLDSVSAVFVFEKDIFIIERQGFLKAFPGYFSFPGGKVDDSDKDGVFPSQADKFFSHPDVPKIYYYALCREILEELDVDLVKLHIEGQIKSIDLLGIAKSPGFNPRRFCNYFFKIVLSSRPGLSIDEGEIKNSFWKKASDVDQMYENGDFLGVPPIIKTVKALSQDIHTTKVENINSVYEETSEVPNFEPVKGLIQMLPLSQTFPPANRTNCFIVGDSEPLIIDPSPKNEAEYDLLKKTFAKYEPKRIFLTHHHRDHYQFSNTLAREFQFPILLSQDTWERISKHEGEDYFLGIEIEIVNDLDVVATWKGQKVQAIHVPGHDEGQMALMPEGRNWCIVGDLIQTVGTVLIGGEEGDMAKYFKSLQKIIDLSPKFIFPSHGIGLGGVDKLVETLNHRKERENQVKELLDQNKSEDEILGIIYEGLDERLKPFALMTIQAHIQKLANSLDS